MSMKLLHGIKVPHRKHTAGCVPQPMNVPPVVRIPMSMSIGKPAVPVVRTGDSVQVGQLIAEPDGFVSSPIYASVSGTVKKLTQTTLPTGAVSQCIEIESDGKQTVYQELKAPELTDFDSFITAVRDSGVVGLGGAGFPTAVKLKVDSAKVDYILINGAECEPYITADTRTMTDDTALLIDGIRLLETYYIHSRIVIGIEDNKPQCIRILREMTKGLNRTEVKALPGLYPQGGEKVLIYNITGRAVPEGKLPIDVGCIVLNTSTLTAIARYTNTGMPLTYKYVTVDGSAIKNPQNVIVPIGTPLQDVIDFTGGFACEPGKIIMGGPMMGMSVPDTTQSVIKNTGSILCLDEREAVLPEPTPCIHCGRCINACPMNLMPVEIEHAFEKKDGERLNKLKVNLCMECGCCSFVCPAKHRLVETTKLGKAFHRSWLQTKVTEEKTNTKKEGDAK